MDVTAPHTVAPLGGWARRSALVARLTAALLIALLVLGLAPASASTGGEFQLARVAGDEQVGTAVAVSQAVFETADAVVLSRVDAYPDALGGAPLARALGGPLLLVHRDEVPQVVVDEIIRLQPQRVVLLGGEAALSEGVAATVAGLGVADVQRVAGPDRFATAAAITTAVATATGARHAFLALGEHPQPTGGWPDAVAVSGYAAHQGRPILLSRTDAAPEATLAALRDNGITHVTIVGGTAVVSDAVATQLTELGLQVGRLGGATRFETSLAVAEAALADGATLGHVWIASAGDFPDPLASGPAVAAQGGVMLLVDGQQWTAQPARAWVAERAAAIGAARVVGSEQVMPGTVLADLQVLLGAETVGQIGPESPAGQTGAVAPPPRAPHEVVIEPGQSIQAVVDAHPAGTSYRIAAGVHRAQMVAPKAGDTFTGDAGAVLSGAILLDPAAFTRSGSTWMIGGRREEHTGMHGVTLPGHERAAAEHDLWADDRRLTHVNSRREVDAPGEWFFDYAADQVVMFDAPSQIGRLELSVAQHAFRSTAPDVTIQHLTITRYASPAQHGAIHAEGAQGWEVAHVTATENHGIGIRIGPGMHLHHSLIADNGQLGVGGTGGTGIVVRHNEIRGNHTLPYDWMWEAGSTKFVDTDGMVFEHNWVHDNEGIGPWWDIDNTNAVIRYNLVEGNTLGGILYEISYGARIYGNVIRNNGHGGYGDIGGGISVSNSRDVEIFENLIEHNRIEVFAVHDERGSGEHGRYETSGLHVHHNDIRIQEYSPGLRVYTGEDAYFTSKGNRFASNTYRAAPGQLMYWGRTLTVSEWQGLGFDVDGRWVAIDQPGRLPSATSFAPAPYGAA